MSGENSSEEKNLPASQNKLRKAREKGQVVTSREAIGSAVMAMVLSYLYMRREAIAADLKAIFSYVPDPDLEFISQLEQFGELIWRTGITIVLPIILGVSAISILAGLLVAGGPVFSTQPLLPEFKKLNPVEGFKKIFGRRALMSFLMHLVRLFFLLTIPAILIWWRLGSLFEAPTCGMPCLIASAWRMVLPILIALLAMLVLMSLLDYVVQRFEFMREQRMSITEFKRELKDQDGDPTLKGQMKSDQRAMVERPTGLSQATAVIRSGTSVAVGIRYVEGDTPAPIVVIRAKGAAAVNKLLKAAPVKVAEGADAVAAIASVPVGDYIVEDEQISAIAPFL